ncbi:sulfite exporter TauE/SafE family protein [Bacillus vallismortis]|uniref:sulfite exporter TauE/SafE family protein n=1 Tax=Bacillus vallismortis TaxID=72361 RepID=UPI000289B6C8|nr:TSUP family transporter [Bacillus vallismortis]MBG9771315.1 membrane protein [Bacillus vallismortis]MCY7918652.1 TSUP family transporter [Bacillus vallismortis]MCY8309165.1 TSUP family transporter [Bacillus vallismortis]MCY8423735.1 TSUP family transporter [Bacillus vallismortis]MCY8531916.1 TSUP family transporter [Bacillus vallismortis]
MDGISTEVLLFLIAAGFAAAFIDSVVGGGGLISIPALLFVGLPPSVALGTNKLAATMGSLTSTINFLHSGQINKKLVFKLLPLSIIGAGAGVYVVQLIPSAFLKPIILILLILVTVYTLFKKGWGMESSFKELTKKMTFFIVSAALLLGFYDGFLGAGTGSFLIFSFLLLGFNFVESAGNAKVLNLGSNIAALITFMLFSSVDFRYGIPMGIAMIVGALVGSRVAIKNGAAYVKVLFVGITVVLIGKSIWDYVQKYIFS